MPAFHPHVFAKQHFILTKDRTIFWEEEKCLILSDLHLGKSGHFRKSGIPVPTASNLEDMQRFMAQIQLFKPGRVVIVGDLFHSSLNSEADFFLRWRKDIAHTGIFLVKGNHDILDQTWYSDAGITLFNDVLDMGPIRFTHGDKEISTEGPAYIISGHTHPAVSIKGVGKQRLSFPCFFFTEHKAVLPAFGGFTGRYTIKPSRKDDVFIITGEEVINMPRGNNAIK